MVIADNDHVRIDPNTGGAMYESDQIVRYLYNTYGSGYVGDIGFADLFLDRYQEAVPLRERFAAIYPNHLLTHLGLSIAYTELGHPPEVGLAKTFVSPGAK